MHLNEIDNMNAFELKQECLRLEDKLDNLLVAAKAALPYLNDRILNDYVDIENVRVRLRQSIKNCEEA